MAHAIPEPLKVRIITKGDELNWILKPVQKAMWRALQEFPCFKLTGTPEIPLDTIASWKGSNLLSGDYEAATDNLNMDIMDLAVSELVKVLPQEYHKWLSWEGGCHEIHYPPDSKLSPVLQTRGQLMGSLLSFPILCVANAATIGMVLKKDLIDLPALINGDDILFKANLRQIEQWKRVSSSMGLKPSIGKNYMAPGWGTINSQLVVLEGSRAVHESTGSFGATGKVSNYLQCLCEAIRIDPENKPSFIVQAKKILKRTPQSVDISVDFGGLGPINFKKEELRDKEIYIFKLLKRSFSKILEIDDQQYWRLPKHLFMLYKNVLNCKVIREIPDIDPDEADDDRIFPYREFRQFQKWYKSVPVVRERVWSVSFEKEIPLNLIKPVTVLIPKSHEKFVENLKIRI
jgi:hypothetical protein